MLYFAQDVGEPGDGDAGFGDPTRTTIFDYWGVPSHQRWMNGGAFDGAALSAEESALRKFYVRLMNLSASHPALNGEYAEIHSANRATGSDYDERLFSFVRWNDDQQLIIVSNFDAAESYELNVVVSENIISTWGLTDGRFALTEQLYGENASELLVENGSGQFRLELDPMESVVFELGESLFARSLDAAVYIADWQGSGVKGTLVYWQDVSSELLAETRHVEIWLPPDYDDDPNRRYRVIYMSDGENLFDPRIANTGIDWGVDEAMMRGVELGLFEPAIVVATWSTARRTHEYSPWHDAPLYARFLIEELMPRVNAEFRTLTGSDNTFVMGSSMGGLLSFYLVKNHPDVFGACGCVSTAFLVSAARLARSDESGAAAPDTTPYIVRDIEDGDTVPHGVRMFFDHGTEGLDAQYGSEHDAVREWLLKQGFRESEDFMMRVYDGANHNEASWRARLDDQFAWLLADE